MRTKKELCNGLHQFLGLRSNLIAVRMLRDESEIPANAVRPLRDTGHHLSMCQAFSLARRQGQTIAMLHQDNWCVEPVIGFVYTEVPEYFLTGANRYPESASSLEAGSKWAKNMPKIAPGQYIGVLAGPWETVEFEPDVVLMYCDPAQLTHLLISVNWIDGSDVYSQLSGHSACVYAVVPAMLKHDFYISVPCIGDRKHGVAQDSEMIFTFTPDKAEALLDGLCTTAATQVGFPIKYDVSPEYKLLPAYKKIGEMLGLEY